MLEEGRLGIRKFQHHVLPHDSKPPLNKVSANWGGKRLQTGDDRSLRRGLNHAVPAGTQTAARCFTERVTLWGRNLAAPLPDASPTTHRQYFAKTVPTEGMHRRDLLRGEQPRLQKRDFRKRVFQKQNFSVFYPTFLNSWWLKDRRMHYNNPII